jgi:quinol monooxygenase YgiN
VPHIALLELNLKTDDVQTSYGVIEDVLTATRAFAGCLGVETVADVEDPAHVMIIETWESAEAVAAYRAWRKTPEGASDLGNVLAGRPTMTDWSSLA